MSFSEVDPTKLASGSDDCCVKVWSINQACYLTTQFILLQFLQDIVVIRVSISLFQTLALWYTFSGLELSMPDNRQSSDVRGYR